MEAVDSYIPEPERDIDKPFLMPIEDVMTITGRTVVTGRIEQGKIEGATRSRSSGSIPRSRRPSSRFEMFNKTLDFARPATTRVRSSAAKREEVERGRAPSRARSRRTRSSRPRSTSSRRTRAGATPFFNGYRPQFYFRTTDVTGSIKLPEGQEMVMPGDNTNMEIEMIQPIAMDQGLRFAVREGGRTVGAGVVTEIKPERTGWRSRKSASA